MLQLQLQGTEVSPPTSPPNAIAPIPSPDTALPPQKKKNGEKVDGLRREMHFFVFCLGVS